MLYWCKQLTFMANTPSKVTDSQPRLARVLPCILLVAGIAGMFSSFMIMLGKLASLADPTIHLNCDLNPIVSCRSIMDSWQGSIFGFPNPLIGMPAFAALAMVGGGMLAGAKFARWFWIGLNIGMLIGVISVHWLFFQSVYSVGELCPYCIVVWLMVITTFWYVALYSVREDYIYVPRHLFGIANFARRHHLEILFLWFFSLAALTLQHFWYFFGQYI